MLGKSLITAAAGAAGGAEALYVESVFQTHLYTGNGSTQTITNGIDLAGEGGLVWTKNRSAIANHFLIDSARNNDSFLISNTTGGEASAGPTFNVVFNSNGFTDGLSNRFFSGANIASWTFRKAEKFFDVVTYAGTGSNPSISHNLGSAPGFIIIKRTDSTSNWGIAARNPSSATGYTSGMSLNSTAASIGTGFNPPSGSITSTIFKPASITDHQYNQFDVNGATYVAYLFAHDAGGFGDDGTDSVVKCGSYTGNGTVNNATTEQPGPDINLGWEPQWVMIKNTTSSDGWWIFDTMRGFNVNPNGPQKGLYANTTGAESTLGTSFVYLKLTNTGFKITAGAGAYFNELNNNYIYIAIRRGPMKTPTDATEVFSANLGTSSSVVPTFVTNFPVDLAIFKTGRAAVTANFTPTRLTNSYLNTTSTAVEAINGSTFSLQSNTGWGTSYSNSAVSWNFRRAPGFFDVVAYTGDGSAPRNINHNLSVTPEMMIIKDRNSTGYWRVFHSGMGATKNAVLNEDLAALTMSSMWNDTAPTDSVFTIGSGGLNANTYTYIAYLFATLPGVSKVGSYTGTGTTLDIDCGFTAGARFVLIKRTDSTGDWYTWDTARGIVSGNDPYLLLNSTGAEVTNTDYIDPLSSGFQISSTAPAAINASGGSYIFLAIA